MDYEENASEFFVVLKYQIFFEWSSRPQKILIFVLS